MSNDCRKQTYTFSRPHDRVRLWSRWHPPHAPFCRPLESTGQCSASEVLVPGESKSDAALPFLSAASGLMLATALQRLELSNFANQDRNGWRWDFDSKHRTEWRVRASVISVKGAAEFSQQIFVTR